MSATAATAQIVSFKCILKTKYGQLISSSVNREVLTSIPGDLTGQLTVLQGLAQGLQNLKKGEKRSISLTAEEAYGFYDPKKVIIVRRKMIPEPPEVRNGQTISIQSNFNEVKTYRVMQIMTDSVLLDGNHPLAGQDLIFEIEAIDARDASADEIASALNPVAVQLLH